MAENSSHRYTKPQIKEMIEHQADKYQWQFVYLGANQDARSRKRPRWASRRPPSFLHVAAWWLSRKEWGAVKKQCESERVIKQARERILAVLLSYISFLELQEAAKEARDGRE